MSKSKDSELDQNQYAQVFLSSFPDIEDEFYTYMQVPQILEHLHKVQTAERLINQKLAQIMGTLIQDNVKLQNQSNEDEEAFEDQKNIKTSKNTHKISQLLNEKISRKKVKKNSQSF